MAKVPPPVLAFGLVLYARTRGGGVAPALIGSALIATLACANRLLPHSTGVGHDTADAMADVFCCGLASMVFAVTALIVLVSPKKSYAEPPESPD